MLMFMRHGEHLAKSIYPDITKYGEYAKSLTPKGIFSTCKIATEMKLRYVHWSENPPIIYHSPCWRTKHTALLLAYQWDINEQSLVEEVNIDRIHRGPVHKYGLKNNNDGGFYHRIDGYESHYDVSRRGMTWIKQSNIIEKSLTTDILVITHCSFIAPLFVSLLGYTFEEIISKQIENNQTFILDYTKSKHEILVSC